MNKKPFSTKEIILDSAILFGLFVVCFYVFFFTFYFHEVGHITFGFANNLLYGHVTHFEIGNWVNAPSLSFFKLPQQTIMAYPVIGSWNFIFGGPILSILLFGFLSYLGYNRSGNKWWFLLIFWMILFELFGNVACGTDNPTGNPLSFCSLVDVGLIERFIVVLFAGSFAFLGWLGLRGRKRKV